MSYPQLTQTLAESFTVLADEVQSLVDRKTILEHKLRYAHEQFQFLADKYAPAVPEVSETLAKLQLPPELRHSSSLAASSFVPLPKRGQAETQHQIALSIREGRRAAQKLASLAEMSRRSGSSKEILSPFATTETMTSLSTALEQDFTVEGRKGPLACPFSRTQTSEDVTEGQHDITANNDDGAPAAVTTATGNEDITPHRSTDPICAAMYEESAAQHPPNASSAQCPIRFLDQHSPEEIAHYVETHKHEIPRSHEVCVSRYQQNEEQIRKLDAKYGNLASMIKDLSHLHQPMLPSSSPQPDAQEEVDRASNERVENWANGVASDADLPDEEQTEEQAEQRRLEDIDEHFRPADHADDASRQSRFDRPLKEVRVGESPSRPWGISVPAYLGSPSEPHPRRPDSPPPAPVRMPNFDPRSHAPLPAGASAKKCPFDHTKLGSSASPFLAARQPAENAVPVAETENRPSTPTKRDIHPSTPLRPQALQPTFISTPVQETSSGEKSKAAAVGGQTVVFNITGPTFIGYPMEQAIQFMQQFQNQRAA